MTGLSIEVVDINKAFAALTKAVGDIREGAIDASKQEGLRELKLTKHRVPWATGQLSKSGRVEGPDATLDTITVDIAYGGPAGAGDNTEDVDYAVIVHEDLEAQHLFGRQAKYVESVVREELESGRAAGFMGQIILKHLGMGTAAPTESAGAGTQAAPVTPAPRTQRQKDKSWATFGRDPQKRLSRYRPKNYDADDYSPGTGRRQ